MRHLFLRFHKDWSARSTLSRSGRHRTNRRPAGRQKAACSALT